MEGTKSNRAFVIVGVGNLSGEGARILADYLLRYTVYDVVLYYGDCSLKPSASPRLKMIDLKTLNLDFDFTKFPNPLNPLAIKLSLETYDEVVYLDSDIQVTPHIQDVFKEADKITDYPLFNVYPQKYMFCHIDKIRHWWVSETIRSYLPYEDQTTNTISVCLSLSNKQCLPFLSEWIELTKKEFFDAINHEEALACALMWNKRNTNHLPQRIVWSFDPEVILEAVSIWNDSSNQKVHPQNPNHFLIQKHFWGKDMSMIPFNKKDLWGVHYIKPIYKIKQIFKFIDKHYSYE